LARTSWQNRVKWLANSVRFKGSRAISEERADWPQAALVEIQHSNRMEWTNDKVISLIELYRNRPVLWDCRLKEYKDRNKRHDALMEIAVSFGVREEEIDRKLKNLICHFSRLLQQEANPRWYTFCD
jgi:hypothetical protein